MVLAKTVVPEGVINVRFGSEADVCVANSHVRFTPNSDRESGLRQTVMSALPPKAASNGVFRKCPERYGALISYPSDLVNLRNAKRTELAERQAAGKITRAQMVLELSQLNSQIESEWQSRNNSNRIASA